MNMSEDARQEAIKAALGVDTPKDAIVLMTDSLIALAARIRITYAEDSPAKALILAAQVEVAVGKMSREMLEQLLLETIARLSSFPPDAVLANGLEGMIKATQGAQNLLDFGIVPNVG